MILTADDIQNGKPDPEIYEKAVKLLNVKKEQSIVFEDSKNGIQSAKNAGIDCIGILNKGFNDDELESVKLIVEGFKDLVTLFES